MLRFLILLTLAGLISAQKSSQEAAIISESRYLNTAGGFGSSYTQEDGVEFREEADSEGNRKGSYTYIDPNGQRKTITYTAGKDGFHAQGDHIPVAPAPVVSPFAKLAELPLPANYQVQQVVLCTLIAFSTGQYQPKASKDAAILEEARYLAVNGQFGSTYKQDDGVEFKEESDGQGNRKGSYSYIDPTGQRRTVTYTAGKDGFRPTGDHLPLPPVPAAAPAPAAVAPAAPAISSNSIQQTGQYNPEDDYQYQDDSQSQYRPSQDYSYNNNYQFNTPNTQQYQQPQYNPVQFQYRSPASAAVPAPAAVPSAYNPSVPSYNPSYNQYTSSEPPHRFYPPGKLSLNRSPDGFSYTFNKV